MRALAEFVMRGRTQAVVVAVLASGIPMFFWLGAAVVGLVTLRRGVRDGAFVMLWALLPAAAVAYFGEIMPAAALLGTLALAWVLRVTVSWAWALSAAGGLGLLLSGGLYTVGRPYLEIVEKLFAEVFEGIEKRGGQEAAVLAPPGAAEIAGMFGLVHALTLVLCLIIARWWQAALYNPGGFRTEFHALRLGQWQVLAMIGLALALGAMGPEFRLWAWVPLVPLAFAGLGLVHAIAAGRGRGGLLGLFYAALLILPPVKQLLVVLAAMDGWLDFRRRWLKPPSQ